MKQQHSGASFRVTSFAYADRWFNRLVNFEKALHKGFWLGCLSLDDRNAVTAESYAASKYFCSTEHVDSGFFDWEARVVERYFPTGSRILIAAAGTGREILALRKAGFQAEGFECNPLLVEAGQKFFERMGQSNPPIFCPPDRVPQGPSLYDGLLVGWGGYTHIPSRPRRVQFLTELRRRAVPQAPLLLSFFTRDDSSRCDRITYRIASICRIFSGARKESLEPGDDLDLSNFIHRFTRAELESELQSAGFRSLDYNEQGDFALVAAIAE
jgi:hypothetical protein